MTYPGTKLTPFSERVEPKKQTRPHGFLDDAAQERARACLSEIRERWTELYPRPNSRQRVDFAVANLGMDEEKLKAWRPES